MEGFAPGYPRMHVYTSSELCDAFIRKGHRKSEIWSKMCKSGAGSIIIECLGSQQRSTLKKWGSNVYFLSRFRGSCYLEFLTYTRSWFVMCRGDPTHVLYRRGHVILLFGQILCTNTHTNTQNTPTTLLFVHAIARSWLRARTDRPR